MQGFITETELDQAEREFPGIGKLFGMLAVKPRTFLELVALYDGWCVAARHTRACRGPVRRIA